MIADIEHNYSYEPMLEKIIYFLILATVFCLPVEAKAAGYFLQAAALFALFDSVLAGKMKLKLTKPFLLFLVFALLAVLSLIKAPQLGESIYNIKILLPQYIFLYWLSISYIKTHKDLYGALSVFLVAAFFVSLYGIYQYFYGSTLLTSEWTDTEYFPTLNNRVFSTLSNPNILASFLVTAIAISLGGILAKIKLRWQGLLILLALTSVVCLVFTFSRGAWISLLVVILMISIVFNYKVLYFFIPATVLTGFLAKDIIIERFLSAFQGADTSSTMRLAMWESTVAMIENNPLLGIGWGSYRFVYHEYDFFINDPNVIIYHAHNMYLNIAAELGIPAFLVFMALIFVHFYFAFKTIKKASTPAVKAISIGLCAMFFGVLIGGLTDYTLFNMELASLFWFLCAMTFVVKNINEKAMK